MIVEFFTCLGFWENDTNLSIYFELDTTRLMSLVLYDDNILLENNVLSLMIKTNQMLSTYSRYKRS